MCLTTAKLAGAVFFRTRHSSSRKTMSMTQCRSMTQCSPFSLLQWPRMAALRVSALAAVAADVEAGLALDLGAGLDADLAYGFDHNNAPGPGPVVAFLQPSDFVRRRGGPGFDAAVALLHCLVVADNRIGKAACYLFDEEKLGIVVQAALVDTIMRLGVRVGEGYARLHDQIVRNIQVANIELDEVWSFVGKKQKRVKTDDGSDVGDQYLFTAMDATGKAILSYKVGKRTAQNTQEFVADLRERVINRLTISSDAFNAYPEAIELAFGADVDYGQIQKVFAGEPGPDAARRYSPGKVEGVNYRRVSGDPNRICTSYVERSNLTVRMQSRRFTRLTNGFSKKLRNHEAAISLFIAHYNLCRVHETIRMTPAMMLGVTDHIWSIAELIGAANYRDAPEPVGRRFGRLRVMMVDCPNLRLWVA